MSQRRTTKERPGWLDGRADTAEAAAEFEVQYARSMADRTAAVETMLIGTVVDERVHAELRMTGTARMCSVRS